MFIHTLQTTLQTYTLSQIFKEGIENYSSVYSAREPLSCNAEIEYETGIHGMMSI
jgi:hypothetical protein